MEDMGTHFSNVSACQDSSFDSFLIVINSTKFSHDVHIQYFILGSIIFEKLDFSISYASQQLQDIIFIMKLVCYFDFQVH